MNSTSVRLLSVSLAMLFVAQAVLFAQPVVRGESMPMSSELLAIMTALRSISQTERVEININRICRIDVTHPDCPAKLKENGFNGRLPGNIWLNARDRLNGDEQMGKQHGSLREATFVSVQRPVVHGDSIIMLVQVVRPVKGAKRELRTFDIVLRGDSARMETVRFAERADPRLK